LARRRTEEKVLRKNRLWQNPKRSTVEAVGAIAIDRHAAVDEYVAEHTGGEGFDIVYDTLGGG
jgi:NADPH:quinone reductase-like Zn-dependent oxidoreductase